MEGFQFCVPARMLPYGRPLFGLDGVDVIKVFGGGTPMIILSLFALAVWNFTCAMWTRYPAAFVPLFGCKVPARRSSVSSAVFVYQVLTGIFFLALTTQLNKMVVLLAALHNWCEWLILGNVYIGLLNSFGRLGRGQVGVTTWNRFFTVWILAVMIGVLLIPDLLESFAFEEVFGLWLDYQLCFISFYCWLRFRNFGGSTVFGNFAAAASFHLAQIILLLLEGMGVISPWPAAQVLIIVTAFFNYAFYTLFALELDSWQLEQVKPKNARDCEASPTSLEGRLPLCNEALPGVAFAPYEDPQGDSGAPNEPDRNMRSAFIPYVPQAVAEVSTSRLTTFMFGCLLLSAASVILPPLVLGGCVQPLVEQTGPYLNLAICETADAQSLQFREALGKSVADARKSPGNLLSTAFIRENKVFRFDKWADGLSSQTFYGRMGPVPGCVAESSSWLQLEPAPLAGNASAASAVGVGGAGVQFSVPTRPAVSAGVPTCLSNTSSGYKLVQAKDRFRQAAEIKIAAMVAPSRARGANFYIAGVSAGSASLEAAEEVMVVWQWPSFESLRTQQLKSQDVLRLVGFSEVTETRLIVEGRFQELVPCEA